MHDIENYKDQSSIHLYIDVKKSNDLHDMHVNSRLSLNMMQ